MNFNRTINRALFLLAAAALFGGCAPGAGLYRLDRHQVEKRNLGDDLDFNMLPEAVRQSITYYRQQPSSKMFRYGETGYTALEMEESMNLFLFIIENMDGEERIEAIRENFHFFESRNEKGRAFFTGYYEPVIPGRRERTAFFQTPVYAVPADLVSIDLDPYVEIGLLPEGLENSRLRGRLEGRQLVPYDQRERIEKESSLEGRAEVLLYLESDIELFFLQIQGSGAIRLEDGSLLRLGYADQNGHPYRAIGRILLDRIPRERMSLQALKEYLYAHPEEVRGILNYNPSYTFFRMLQEGPLGFLERPLTPGRSLAMDHRLIPKGGVAFFETVFPEGVGEKDGGPRTIGRFGVVQDTGGAIRGHGRTDIYWGSGEEAEKIAGPMKEEGRIYLLVARKGSLPSFRELALPPPPR